jgi:hypothetical protein
MFVNLMMYNQLWSKPWTPLMVVASQAIHCRLQLRVPKWGKRSYVGYRHLCWHRLEFIAAVLSYTLDGWKGTRDSGIPSSAWYISLNPSSWNFSSSLPRPLSLGKILKSEIRPRPPNTTEFLLKFFDFLVCRKATRTASATVLLVRRRLPYLPVQSQLIKDHVDQQGKVVQILHPAISMNQSMLSRSFRSSS